MQTVKLKIAMCFVLFLDMAISQTYVSPGSHIRKKTKNKNQQQNTRCLTCTGDNNFPLNDTYVLMCDTWHGLSEIIAILREALT